MPLDGFFDGQFKSTRRVALGGASHEEGDRAALLERAKRDRERRSRLRIETRSAAVVQVRLLARAKPRPPSPDGDPADLTF